MAIRFSNVASLLFAASLAVGCASDTKIGIFNSTPDAAITSHQDGDVVAVGAAVVLVGAVSDSDGAAQSMTVAWTIDGQDACPDAEPDELGATYCQWAFEEGGGLVALQVWDLAGASDSDTIQLDLRANNAPTALIIEPAFSGVYYSDQLITFEGQMSDIEDLPVELVGSWESSLDGALPLDGSPDASGIVLDFSTLSEGNHAITFTATDLVGKTGSDSVTITVGPPNGSPSCAITSPPNFGSSEVGGAVTFTGLVGDPDISPDQLSVLWQSDVDGLLTSSVATSVGDVSYTTSGLSAAIHTITLTVEDEVGATCTDAITFTVGSAPHVLIIEPAMNEVFMLGAVIAFEGEVSDSEDVPTALTLEWESSIDGLFSTQGAASNGVVQFTEGNLSEGTHTVTVTATDTAGLYAEDLVVIQVISNTAPSIVSVSIDPKPAYVDDTLVCSYSGYSDAEGDPDSSTFEWSIGGTVVGTTDSLAGNFVKGDKVKCTITPFDGMDAGAPVSTTRTIKNSPPSVSSVSISPSSSFIGDSLTCSYAGYDDADGDLDTSTFEWSVNGVTAGSGSTLSSGFSGGDTVMCTVTPFDGEDTGSPVSDVITVGNSPPSIAAVDISPDPAYVTDSLGCSYTGFSDPDGDADASSYKWFINGVNSGNSSTLGSGFVKGDTVKCKVTPSDGTDNGNAVSDAVTISNSAPVASGVSIAPSSPTVTDTLDCSYSFFDADGDADESTVEWSIGGNVVGTAASLSGAFVSGDQVTCTVTPTDDEGSGTPESASVTIGNSAPVVTNVSVSPSSPTDLDTLSCSWSFSDDDGDSDSSTVEWTNDSGTSLGTGATLSSGFVAGDLVTCTVTAYDGIGIGNIGSDTVTILASNDPPTVEDVLVMSITDEDGDSDWRSAIATDTLECSWTFDDPDGDGDNSSVAWTNDSGTLLGAGTSLSGAFAKGDMITCTVTANDGTVDGNSESDSLPISNAWPVVSGVIISATTNMDGDNNSMTANASDTLECEYTFTDVDGDGDASTLEWTVGATVLGTTSTQTGGFVGGDTVFCSVNPYDGTEFGLPMSAQITIVNSAPTVTGVTVLTTTNADADSDATTAIAVDTLECSWTYDDVDGDGDSSTVEWTNGSGTSLGTSTTLSGAFAKGDTVTCTVTPNDGTVDGTSDSGSIDINNAAPTVTGVTVLATTNADADNDATTAIATDTLECSWTYDDVDGDGDSSTAAWTNGSGASLGTSTTLSGAFAKGDTVICTVTPNDGAADGTPDTGSILIDNAAPTVAAVVVLSTTDADADMDSKTAVAADTLECNWTYDDVDGDGDSSTVEWTNGSGASLGTSTTLSGAFAKGDTVTCTVTSNDGTVDGTAGSGSIDIDNAAPTVTGVTVLTTTNADSDSDATTAIAPDTLECSWTYDDVDGDGDSSTVEWTNGSGASLGTSTTLSGAFAKGDTVTCTVTPNDGAVNGTTGSDSIDIDNATPTVTGVTVLTTTNADADNDATTAIATDTLECSWTYDDVDGDGDSSTVAWTNGSGTPLGTTTTLSGAFAKDDTVICTVTPNDGAADGTPDTGSILIDNAAPTVAAVVVVSTTDADADMDSKTAVAADTLECSWTYDDVDGDGDSSTVEWTNGSGASLGTSTTLSGAFAKGDTVTCTVTSNDGTVNGTSDSDSIDIDNTAPTVTSVTVLATTDADSDSDFTTAIAADSLECSWTYDDADFDGDSSTVAWTNGSGASLGTGTTLSGAFIGGDTVTCTVTSNDGTVNGTSDSASIVIGNTAPTVMDVTVLTTTNADADSDANTAIAADTLECTWTYDDVDGGSDSSTLVWTDDTGTALGTGTTLSGAFVGADIVTCTVTPNDGTVNGTPDSASIIIGNTAPTVTAVTVLATTNEDGDSDASTAIAADSLECSWTYDDVDGDGDSSTAAWTNSSGASLGTGTTLSGVFVKGDTVICTVTPNDGFVDGTADSGSITIDNALPEVTNVAISPDPASTFDPLTVSYTFDDGDVDTDQSTIVWEVDSSVIGGATGSTLDSVHTFPGAVVTVTVTPFDGSDSGVPQSDSLTIDDYVACGNGSTGIPVATCEQLEQMDDDLTESYCLVQDVFCSAIIDFATVADAGVSFSGSFNGAGYTISDLSTSGPGLFGSVDGVLQSVVLENVSVSHSGTAGGLAAAYSGSADLDGAVVSGTVSSISTTSAAGGIVGSLSGVGMLTNSSFIGDVVGGSSGAGGLVGNIAFGTGISDSVVDATVSGSSSVGGAVGQMQPPSSGSGLYLLSNVHVDGAVMGSGSVGGLAGALHGEVDSCTSTASVDATSSNAGGLVGILLNYSEIRNSTASGSVSGGLAYVGGLVGFAGYWTDISQSSASGDVNSTGHSTGGLVGRIESNSLISECIASGQVDSDQDKTGGLVGQTITTTIERSVATGDVNAGSSTNFTGGLVGIADGGRVDDSYATGAVTGGSNRGGLFGRLDSGGVYRSYSSGLVSSSSNSVGGLIGDAMSSPGVTNSYWDTVESGAASSDGGDGKTSFEMVQQSTYGTWDFGTVWTITDGTTYPCLQWQGTTCAEPSNLPPTAPVVSVKEGTTFTRLDAGGWKTCALDTAGAIACWGWMPYYSNPPLNFGYTDVSAGLFHGCALDASGSVECWGLSGNGQTTPPTSVGSGNIALSLGAYHSCVLDSAGAVECWGPSPGETHYHSQVTNAPTGSGYTTLVSGYNHTTCVLDAAGNMECWGEDASGIVTNTPTTSGWTGVAPGSIHICALDSVGAIDCWGNGLTSNAPDLINPPASTGNTAISAGYLHTCVLEAAGTIDCWGVAPGDGHDHGQVSDAPTGSNYVAISAGWYHNCALDTAGDIECWGKDADGQVSDVPSVTGSIGLICLIDSPSTDPNGDTISYTVEWDVDGSPYTNATTTTHTGDTVPPGDYSVNQTWTCTATPNDGQIDGPPGTDDYVVPNKLPTVASVAITPDPATEIDLLTAVPSGWDDPDGHAEDYLYEWTVDSSVVGGDTATLNSSYTVIGSVVTVTITAWDGLDYGNSVTSSPLTIGSSCTDDGSAESCPGVDCWSLLDAGYATGDGTDDGIYWIDPQSDGTAFEAYCVMDVSFDGGGWTLGAVTSDDGQDTWTWDNRAYWETDTATFGSLSVREEDFKSEALHEVRAADMLFIHHPSDVWAGYNFVSPAGETFAETVYNTGGPNCYDTGDGYPLTAGTLTNSGYMCETSLYFNALDRDGGSCPGNNSTSYGPTWNAYQNASCPFDDPHVAGLGGLDGYTWETDTYISASPFFSQPAGVGFGGPLLLNTGTLGAAENSMWVLVRDRRIPIPTPADTCAEVSTQPVLPAGSYSWEIDGYTDNVGMNAGAACGYLSLGGHDGIFKVDLAAGETIEVDYWLTTTSGNNSRDSAMALTSACDDSFSDWDWEGVCVVGADDNVSSFETMTYTNTSGSNAALYLTLDAYAATGALTLTADVAIY